MSVIYSNFWFSFWLNLNNESLSRPFLIKRLREIPPGFGRNGTIRIKSHSRNSYGGTLLLGFRNINQKFNRNWSKSMGRWKNYCLCIYLLRNR